MKVAKVITTQPSNIIRQAFKLKSDLKPDNMNNDILEKTHQLEHTRSKDVKEYKLKIIGNNDVVLPIRGDGMVNATILCKAGKKLFADYNRQKQNKAYFEALQSSMGIPMDQLVTTIEGGKNEYRGTWVHRKVAYHLAQWISPSFAVQVSSWLDELFVTGLVELGNEISTKQLEIQFQNKIKGLELENDRLLRLHNSSLMKHAYYKFQKGPVFYIITSGMKYEGGTTLDKMGIAGCPKREIAVCPNCDNHLEENKDNQSLDTRLKDHRTLWPQLEVKFVVYTTDAALLEKNMKRYFKEDIQPSGHELVYNVSSDIIIDQAKTFLDLFNLRSKEKKYMIADDIEKYNTNSKTHMKERLIDDLEEEETNVDRLHDFIVEMEDEQDEYEDRIEKLEEVIEERVVEKEEYEKKIEILDETIEENVVEKGKYEEKVEEISDNISKKKGELNERLSRIKSILNELEKYNGKHMNEVVDEFEMDRGFKRQKVEERRYSIKNWLNEAKGAIDTEEELSVSGTEPKTFLLSVAERLGLASGLCSTKDMLYDRISIYLNINKVLVNQHNEYSKVCVDCDTKKRLDEDNYTAEFRSLKHNEPPIKLGYSVRCIDCMKKQLDKPRVRNIVATKVAKATLKDDEKICGRCKEVKKKSCYSSNKSRKDGLSQHCGPCNSARLKESRMKKSLS